MTWRLICPNFIKDRMREAQETRMLIISRTGPLGFMLKDVQTGKKYKIFLGEPHTCSCVTFMKKRDLCVHILWVLLKKFRIAQSNALVWQRSLNEREILQLLKGELISSPPNAVKKELADVGKREEVAQREITDEDVCPICQCEFLRGDNNGSAIDRDSNDSDEDNDGVSKEGIVYCNYGCGSSVHAQCMMEWAKHARSQGEAKAIKCPLCRTPFGTFEEVRQLCLKDRRKELRVKRNNLHLGFKCQRCKSCPISGKWYSCTVCQSYYLCQDCFASGEHTFHNFTVKKTVRDQACESSCSP
eukprot:m.96662 g.96662  ORF g.96662 m.96662 type:complete len:301 (-) comp8970_c0_seq2:1768-2670(-)